MDALIAPPEGSLEILSRVETNQLRDAGEGGLYELWRQCSLAVLNSGASDDDVRKILSRHENFASPSCSTKAVSRSSSRTRPTIAFVGSADDSRHSRASVRRAARPAVRARRRPEQPALRSRELERHHRCACSTSCATRACCALMRSRGSSSAGAVTPSSARSTTTRRWSATRSGSRASTSARAAAPAP